MKIYKDLIDFKLGMMIPYTVNEIVERVAYLKLWPKDHTSNLKYVYFLYFSFTFFTWSNCKWKEFLILNAIAICLCNRISSLKFLD